MYRDDIHCAPPRLLSREMQSRGGAGISILYSITFTEQVLRVREEPTKGGARACDAGVMSPNTMFGSRTILAQ